MPRTGPPQGPAPLVPARTPPSSPQQLRQQQPQQAPTQQTRPHEEGAAGSSLQAASSASATPAPDGTEGVLDPQYFWDTDGYKIAGKRIRNTAVVADEFIRMMQERVTLEKKIAKQLKAFSTRWDGRFDKTPDYCFGSACKLVCEESSLLADAHLEVQRTLETVVIPEVANFKRSLTSGLFGKAKVLKDTLHAFEVVAKPYNRIHDGVDKCKKMYTEKCEEGVRLSAMLLEADRIQSSTSEADSDRIRRKIDVVQREAEEAEILYRREVEEAQKLIKTFERDMRAQFKVCQEQHRQRLQFIKDSLGQYLTSVALSNKLAFDQSLQAPAEALHNASIDTELVRFQHDFGVDGAPKPAEFVPFVPQQAPMEDVTKVMGAWFTKSAESAFSLSHNRFFVLDPEKRDLAYYAACNMGVPSSLKGRINLDQVSDVRLTGREIQIKVGEKYTRMTSKREEEAANWAAMIARAAGVRLSEVKSQAALQQEILQHHSATIIQKRFRGHRERKRFLQKKKAAITIQSHYRGFRARKEAAAIRQQLQAMEPAFALSSHA